MNDEIIIVTGLPRSGTSMMMRMLASGGVSLLMDGERIADEDNPHGYFEYGPVKRLRENAAWLEQARGRAVKIVSFLLEAMPSPYACAVVFMHRPLSEVLASQEAMMRRRAASGAIAADLADPAHLELETQRLAGIYDRHLQQVRAWLEERPGTRVLDLHYGAVLSDPGDAAQQVSTFLGMDADLCAMARAVDASLYHCRS